MTLPFLNIVIFIYSFFALFILALFAVKGVEVAISLFKNS